MYTQLLVSGINIGTYYKNANLLLILDDYIFSYVEEK